MNNNDDNIVNATYNTTIFVYPDLCMQEINNWKEKFMAIVEQVPSKADSLKPIIQFLVAAISPAKIYMMRNEDLQKKPDYIDLLIIIPSNKSVSFTELEPILDIPYLKNQRVSCSLHNEGSVLESLRSGHIFYSLNCISENLIYDDSTLTYPITSQETLQNLKQLTMEKFKGYYDKATDFYDCALSLNEIRSTPITLFMLHQAVELIYRGILLSLNGYDKKTHEIRVLKKYIRRCAPQINDCFPGQNENEERLLNILDAAYLRARYDDNYAIEDNDLTALFERIKQLLFSSKKVVKAKLEKY